MPKRRSWSDVATAKALVFAAAALILTVSALVGWRLLGAGPTDPFSETQAFGDALNIADGHHKYGIVSYANFPNGPSYALVPFMRLGIREPPVLRRVPYAFALLCEGLLLAAIAAMRVSAGRRLWLLLAMGTIYLQPGVVGWLGAFHEHSYVLSCAFAMLAASISLRERFLPVIFALMFLAGWLGYDFVPAQFFAVLAIRWLVHCRDAADGDLEGPLRQTALDGAVAGAGMGLAVLTHLLQNTLYYGGFVVALKSLAGSAAARMSLKVGADLDPAYYKFVQAGTQSHGNPPRLDLIVLHLRTFFTTWWTYPTQFVLLGVGTVTVAATSRRISLRPRDLARAGVFFACVFFCVTGWILLMPWHAANHLHFLPRHFFVAAAVLILAGVMLPDASSRRELSERLPPLTLEVLDVPALWRSWFPALRITGVLGVFFFILNRSSHWGLASDAALRWRIFILFGALMSVWTLAARLARRPKNILGPRLELALLVALGCSSAYGLLCIAAEIVPAAFSEPTLFLTVIAAVFVIGKYWFERKSAGLAALSRATTALVALVLLALCAVAWLEAGRLMFWRSFPDWIMGQRALIRELALLSFLVPVLLLWEGPRSTGLRRRSLQVFDVLAVLVFFIFAFEKDALLIGGGDFNYPVFIAPVDYIRSGGHLLWDVPSQYGFLNILLVAALKWFKSPEAFYLVNSTLIFLGTLISYGAFRWAWPALGAPLVGIPFILGSSVFMPGWASAMYSPQLFPSDGPFRYLVCYLLVLLLLLSQLPGWKEKLPLKRVVRLGNGLWLLGCLWSAESLAYCSAIWFPAVLLLDGQRWREDPAESLGKAFARSARLLRWPALLLGAAAAVLSLDYLLRIGHLPDFKGYYDYALSFKGGFGANPMPPEIGDHWLILFFFTLFLVVAFSVKPAQRPAAAAALFSSWAVASYYAALSHPHSLLNLFPIFILTLHVMIFILRNSPIRGEWDLIVRSAVRAISFALISFVLMTYFYAPSAIEQKAAASLKAMRLPFSNPSQLRWNGETEPVSDFTNAYDAEVRASLVVLLRKEFKPAEALCVVSLEDYWHNEPEQQVLWSPFLSKALVWALPMDVRLKYWDRFMARVNSAAPSGKCPERWLAYHDPIRVSVAYFHDPMLGYPQRQLQYLLKTMSVEKKIDSGAWHLVELSSAAPALRSRLP